MKTMRIALFGIIALWTGSESASADLKPEEIFEMISPHLVEIETPDGQGSGIVIDADGLVLTSLHVVSTGLEVTMTGKSEVAEGKMALQHFKKGVLHKVHPTRDLALVKFDPAGLKLNPATIPDKQPEIKNGAVCYALGSPAGAGGALTNSISDGVISSAKRVIDGDELIQFSAPVNPGNSGGALCDREGGIIGIVTFKLEQREGIAFAIPVGGIDFDEFVKPEDRVGDQDRLKKLIGQAQQLYRASTGSVFDLRPPDEEYLALATALLQIALTEEPCNLECFRMLGWINNLRDNLRELARVYYTRGLEIAPGDALLSNRLGNLESVGGNHEAAIRAFRVSLQHADEMPSPADGSATKMAELLSKQEAPNWNQVAYLLK